MATISPDVEAGVGHTGGRWVRPKIIDIPPAPHPQIRRYVLFRTPLFGVYIHKLLRPDMDRDPHNHPRVFWTRVLSGGYGERVVFQSDREPINRSWGRNSFHKMGLDVFHQITDLYQMPTWTVLIVGRQRQRWGFLTPEVGFVDADDYKDFLKGKADK